MIGFYDYTIILTLCSLISAIFGMTQSLHLHFRMAIFCLAACGLFDTFDGKVARTKKNRTDDEKLYGIQLDSLVDVVSFGIFPVIICYLMGMRSTIDLCILCFYGICGVIRLAYFNVLETNRQMFPNGEEKIYHGLPITSISGILPLTSLLSFVVSENAFMFILRAVLFLTGLLFIIDFKMKKPTNTQIILLMIVGVLAACAILLFSKYKPPISLETEEPWLSYDESFQEMCLDD